jgi:tRNA(Ile)-lysidine synthase TilS/MesJ
MNSKDKKGILISVFQIAESGELLKIEQSEITNALFSYGISIKPNEVNETFKNIRTGTRQLMEQIEKCLDSSLESVKEFHSNLEKHLGKIENLPKGATSGDDVETIKFIQSLEKDAYNFSQAEKLIGITRQTIKKHAESGLHSLITTEIGKTDYITRENLIIYYRDYFKKDGWGF